MENKTIEFVRGFNSELETMNQYCNLEYVDNGFTKAIKLPKIFLFDDDNDSSEYVEERSLSRLVKTLGEVLAVGKIELANKVDEFFAERKKQKKKMKTTIYSHKKGGKYIVLKPFKFKFENTWYESILYQDIDSKEVYGRIEESFNNSFKVVE